ncbi:hypothetical protein FA95DRAFT_949602 [Auriscalpium vulgare]|uniref:Uncharacterized protein n=1 Tax=Auriscalpium vulgare TaxID=40419 RepID=A0ACB8RZ30_9AGAM|nr:hypothetical protein FA95DRAFT_949602 [Auriscalpium vulgare]
MSSFSLELLSEIAGGVDSEKELRQLRAVNKIFNKIVSADAFRKLTVTPSVKSARGLLNILNMPELIVHVQEIEFVEEEAEQSQGSEDGASSDASESEVGGDGEGEASAKDQDPTTAKEILAEAYALLHLAPSLHTLTFKFSSTFTEDEGDEDEDSGELLIPSDSLLLHWAILGAIANNPHPLPKLRTLTLDNFLQHRNDLFDTPHFAAIVRGLHHLHLNFLGDDEMEGATLQQPLEDFWEQAQERLLRPAVELRSLHLESNIEIGSVPEVVFARLTYPHLQSVYFRNVLFYGLYPDPVTDGAEDFIARHGKTLRKLELHQCSIFYEWEEAPARFWATIWRRFTEELEVLSELVVEFEQDEGTRSHPELRYSLLSDGIGYIKQDEDIPGEEDDREALDALKAHVGTSGRRIYSR